MSILEKMLDFYWIVVKILKNFRLKDTTIGLVVLIHVSFSDGNHATRVVGSNLKFHAELMKRLNDSTLNVNICYITK